MSFARSCSEQLTTSKLISLTGKLSFFKNCVLQKSFFQNYSSKKLFYVHCVSYELKMTFWRYCFRRQVQKLSGDAVMFYSNSLQILRKNFGRCFLYTVIILEWKKVVKFDYLGNYSKGFIKGAIFVFGYFWYTNSFVVL